MSTMNHSTVTDVSALFQPDCNSRKHVNRTIFLYVTAILDHNASPIASYCCPRSYVYVLSNGYIASHSRKRVYKCGRVNNGSETFEFVYHTLSLYFDSSFLV